MRAKRVLLADQMLSRIEWVHKNGLIHCDIKPQNFIMGRDLKTLYLIDYGLSKNYKNARTNQHIPKRDGVSFAGTPVFASINAGLGAEQSRRDDMESLGYVLMFLLKGDLPWEGYHGRNILENTSMHKYQTSPHFLCEGFPKQFSKYLDYCKNQLEFDMDPNYFYLRQLFQRLAESGNYKYDLNFYWINNHESCCNVM